MLLLDPQGPLALAELCEHAAQRLCAGPRAAGRTMGWPPVQLPRSALARVELACGSTKYSSMSIMSRRRPEPQACSTAWLYTSGCQQRMCAGPAHSPWWSHSTSSSRPDRWYALSTSFARK